MKTPFDILAAASYVVLTTFRRDGTAVPTPVWVVRIGDELVVWSNPAAGKMERIRRDPHIEIGPCTRRGKPLGLPIPGMARILGPSELAAVRPALIGKYGLIARLTWLPAALMKAVGKPPPPVGGLAITLPGSPAPVGAAGLPLPE
jgi:hypothetical protein